MKQLLIGLFVFLTLPASAAAQDSVGAIQGFIRNLQGTPIEGATVYAYNTAHMTGRFVRYTAVSNSNGSFALINLPPGEYRVHSYKKSENYADTFFLFFKTSNTNAWKTVRVDSRRAAIANLTLGPKYAKLKISIRNQLGVPIGGGLSFKKIGDPEATYSVGVNADSELLVPAVPFEVEVITTDYESWKSPTLRPHPEETINLKVQLKPSNRIR